WRKEIAYEPKKRTLAAAGRSEQRDKLALGDAQADVGKRLHLAALALEAQAYAVEYDAWARGPTRRNRKWRGDLRERRIALPASFHQSISASTGVSMSRARPPNGLALIKASWQAKRRSGKGLRRSAREPESNSSTGHVGADYLPRYVFTNTSSGRGAVSIRPSFFVMSMVSCQRCSVCQPNPCASVSLLCQQGIVCSSTFASRLVLVSATAAAT